VETAHQDAGSQTSKQTDAAPKKTAPVVQAVVAEEQRQMEMDFVGELPTINPTKEADVDQVRAAVDGLDELETALKSEPRYGMAVR
jgi:type IV secretion system protein VirD4